MGMISGRQTAILIFLFAGICGPGASCSSFKDSTPSCNPVEYLFAYHPDGCRNLYGGTGTRNILYFADNYYCRIAHDTVQYRVIVGMDSSMDLAKAYSGFYNAETTQMVAVYGNSTCDMIEQLPNVYSANPEAVIYSTNGWNDILGRIQSEVIVDTFERLIAITRTRWPGARIIVIGIHPSLMEVENREKGYVNRMVQHHVESLPNTCYIDPLPLFGVEEGQAAPVVLMRDPLHYSRAVSFAIKSYVKAKCGVDF